MEKYQKNIDDLFKEELGDYTEAPPPVVWDALEKRLGGNRKRRGGYFRWYWSTLMLLGISLGAAVIVKWPSSLFTGGVKNKQQNATIVQAVKYTTNTPAYTQAAPISTLKNTGTINAHIKRHLKTRATANNTGISRQTIFANKITNTQPANNNGITNNKTIAGNTSSEGNNDNLASATLQTTNHIAFKKYEPAEPTIIKTRQHNILVTQAEPPEPIASNDDSHTMQQSLQKETSIEDNAATLAVHKKERDASTASKSPNQPAKTIIKAANANSTKAKIIAKNDEITNSKSLIQAKTVNTKQYKKQPQHKNTVAAIHKKKQPLIYHTSNLAVKPLQPKTHQKQKTAENKPYTYAAKALVKKVGKLPVKNNNALAQKSNVKHHIHKASKLVLASNKTIVHKATPPNKQPVITIPPPAKNIYSNANTNTPSAITQAVQAVTKKEEPKIMATFKTDTNNIKKAQVSDIASANSNTNNTINTDSNSQSRMKFGKFEAGIKAGYEGGFNNNAAKKIVISPYLQYNISAKLSIMTQPSINASRVSAKLLSGTQSFYQVNNDGKYTMDSVLVVIVPGGDTVWRRNYNYTESHDSIVKSYTSGGTYIEIELPIMAKYSINKKLSVYGGPVLDYSKLVGISEKTYNSGPIVKTGSTFTVGTQASAVPPIGSVITYGGTPISKYSGPLYPSEQKDLFSFGYMFGISYEFRKRWLIDALIHQSFVKPDVQGGYDINKPYSAPYFRITLGYKLIK